MAMAAGNFINLGYEWFTRKGNPRRSMLMENEMALKDTHMYICTSIYIEEYTLARKVQANRKVYLKSNSFLISKLFITYYYILFLLTTIIVTFFSPHDFAKYR